MGHKAIDSEIHMRVCMARQCDVQVVDMLLLALSPSDEDAVKSVCVEGLDVELSASPVAPLCVVL